MSITDIQPGTTFRWKDLAFRRLPGPRAALYLGSLIDDKATDPLVGCVITFLKSDQSLIPIQNLTNTKP